MRHFLQKALLSALVLNAAHAQAGMSQADIRQAYLSSYQYEKAQNYTDAIKAISVIKVYYPKTYTVNLRLGYLHYINKQYANAKADYQLAHKAVTSSLSPLLGLMSIALAQKDYQAAETFGFNILKTDLYNYYANLKLAYLYIQTQKWATAEKITTKMLALYPENIDFLSQYAYIQSQQGKPKLAANAYNAVLTLDPENVEARYYFSSHSTEKLESHVK